MMYVLALYIPHEEILPDIYQEYGKIRYFKTGNEAEDILGNPLSILFTSLDLRFGDDLLESDSIKSWA